MFYISPARQKKVNSVIYLQEISSQDRKASLENEALETPMRNKAVFSYLYELPKSMRSDSPRKEPRKKRIESEKERELLTSHTKTRKSHNQVIKIYNYFVVVRF